MVYTYQMLLLKYKDYVDPKGKISRLEKSGKLFKLKRGIYEDNKYAEPVGLAQYIYGPSYVSFEFVLSKYDLIPEATMKYYSSATIGKRRQKKFYNHFGLYTYQDIPEEVYPYGVHIEKWGNATYQEATIEKALCDQLYKLEPRFSMKEFKELIFVDLRIEEDDLINMDVDFIKKIAPMYKKRNLNWLVKLLDELKSPQKSVIY